MMWCGERQHVRTQKGVHPPDLRLLVGLDVRGEAEDGSRLRRARRGVQVGDHDERALVVADHILEEEPVEVGAGRGGELRHLVRREHPGHERVVASAVVRVLA